MPTNNALLSHSRSPRDAFLSISTGLSFYCFPTNPMIVLSFTLVSHYLMGPDLSLPLSVCFPISKAERFSSPCLAFLSPQFPIVSQITSMISALTSATCLTSPSSSRPFALPQKHFAQHRNHRHVGCVDAENPTPELLQAQLPALFLFWLRMLSQSPPHLELVPSHIRRTLLSHSFEEVGVPGTSPSSLACGAEARP